MEEKREWYHRRMTLQDDEQVNFDKCTPIPEIAKLSLEDTASERFSMFEPTEVFNAYWRFAVERQNIFFKRQHGFGSPWTDDPILDEHKFTNTYRVLDRVSQYLVRHVQVVENREDIFFRTILFKFFNKIETWEAIERETGPIHWASYNRVTINDVLNRIIESGRTIYSAAYIMPSGGKEYKGKRKHEMHLDLIERMMQDELPEALANCKRMRDAYDLLLTYPSIGPFLAYQYITDLNYTTLTDFTEKEFVVAGPGAKRGIDKAFANKKGLSYEELIALVCKHQDDEFKHLKLDFPRVRGRALQLIDCQNLFCEIDKYSRKAFTRFNTAKKPARIKQKFVSNGKPQSVVFPSKWNI